MIETFPQVSECSWTERYAFGVRLQKERDSILELAQDKMGEQEAGRWWGTKINEQVAQLKGVYGEDGMMEYIAGHVLVHSSFPELPNDDDSGWEMDVTGKDYPGELSIERFYKELSTELGTK